MPHPFVRIVEDNGSGREPGTERPQAVAVLPTPAKGSAGCGLIAIAEGAQVHRAARSRVPSMQLNQGQSNRTMDGRGHRGATGHFFTIRGQPTPTTVRFSLPRGANEDWKLMELAWGLEDAGNG